MIGRRFALALGLLAAVVTSQLPEFVQQYRQRLGGTLDEIRREVERFGVEAAGQSLSPEAAVARLRASPDPLVRARGDDAADAALRQRGLESQQRAFAEAGPLSQYWVFLSDLDPVLAANTYAIFQPAVPVSSAGFAAGAVGLGVGWAGGRLIGAPFRRRRVGTPRTA